VSECDRDASIMRPCPTGGLLRHGEKIRTVLLGFFSFFYVSLTVHLSITLVNDQIDAQIFNTFITIL